MSPGLHVIRQAASADEVNEIFMFKLRARNLEVRRECCVAIHRGLGRKRGSMSHMVSCRIGLEGACEGSERIRQKLGSARLTRVDDSFQHGILPFQLGVLLPELAAGVPHALESTLLGLGVVLQSHGHSGHEHLP